MNQNRTGWIIAALLAVVILVLLGMMWNDANNKDLNQVLEEGRENLIDVRAEIEKKCEGPEMNEDACQDALEELADVLEEFREDVTAATSSATTTPPTPQ
ncbi:MAG TPA: hypothetical protein VEB18_01750 [Candidatus Paceibacterota bacterium]|nr:hypothetical protein [Candidatus Paceibacterota bacterium]